MCLAFLRSDPVPLRVRSLTDLLVSAYVPQGIPAYACQNDPINQALVEGSDATSHQELIPGKCLATRRPLLSEVDVQENRPHQVVVTLGDSITDGVVHGVVDPKDGERGWPGVLARRLAGRGISVVNAGIAGNRLLRYSQIISRAHEHGVRVIGATITPFKGTDGYSAEKERIRETVNDWIRTSKAFDGVVDFDRAVRDPDHPKRLKKDYDSGDHLHPNPVGYRHMGEVIDLRLFN